MSFETTNPPGARELLEGDDGWIYLDVRTVEEYEQGHAPGAYNIPVVFRSPTGEMSPNDEFATQVAKHFPADTPIVMGCAMGGRSQRACEILAASGYQKLMNMYGGFVGARDPMGQMVEPGWQACGFPTTTGEDPERGYAALQG